VFQRKYDEASHCVEAILRLLGSGLAQMTGGVRQDDWRNLSPNSGKSFRANLPLSLRELLG